MKLQQRFDDVIEDGYGAWSYICEEHAVLSNNCGATLSETANEGLTCGVRGCEWEAQYYVDFEEETK